jgi:tetratricopeptide (TPR) repeat protein/serine/threonine protein kinase
MEQIGEGGMGTVWMAQQTEPVKRVVALKLVKAGMDSKQVIARFEAERQALALMDHPNIARVLDGGTTKGEPGGVSSARPYFVMDLVKGMPITKYCDEQHLTPRQRLELFVPVCQAVQHAHQKGIIHRDLKPSNVLVALYDGKPVPKVIDFGVAKAAGRPLTEKTLVTGFGAIVGALEYMSPEQAEVNQLDIDTRSDIYSLGVLLYELLAGSPPFSRKELEKAGMLEMLRLIREREPTKPSTKLSTAEGLPTLAANRGTEPAKLTKLVRGELDWIVMKALEKNRSRRYETANGFAMDVQRYLAGEPVLACPPSVGYRLRKFVRRNRGRLAAAAVLGVALLAVLITVAGSIGWLVRDRAERRSRQTRQAELILDDVERLEWQQKWREARAAVERAEVVMPGDEISDAIPRRVHEAQRDLAFVTELEHIREARAATIEGKFDNAGAVRAYAQAFRNYGVDLNFLSTAEAVSQLKRNPALRQPIADALDVWANASRSNGKALAAVACELDPDPLRNRLRATWGRSVTPELQAELRQLGESIDAKSASPTTVEKLAVRLGSARLTDLAIRILRDCQFAHPRDFWLNLELGFQLTKRREYGEAQAYVSSTVSVRPDSAVARNNLGASLYEQGRLDEAIACFEKALQLDPSYVAAHLNLGLVSFRQKNFEQAFACYQKAIALNPQSALCYNNLGSLLRHQKKPDQAIANFRKAIELDPGFAPAHANLGNVFIDQGNLANAIACFEKALELDTTLANAHNSLGTLYFDQHELNKAIVCFKKAIELEPKDPSLLCNLGVVYRRQKKFDEAIACFQKAIDLYARDTTARDRLALTYADFGLNLRDQRKLDEAIRCLQKAIELDSKLGAAYYNLGLSLLDQEKLEAAIPQLGRAIELGVKYGYGHDFTANAHNALGWALIRLGRLDEAIPPLTKAIDLDPKNVLAHDNLGIVHLRRNELDRSVTCFRRAVDLAPGSAARCAHLGSALAAQKKLDEAIECFKTAIKLEPKYAYAHSHLGRAFQSQGKRDEATSEFLEVLRLNPRAFYTREWLLETLAPLGRLEEVRAAWEQALTGDPADHDAWFGYPELCLFLNNEDAYRRNRTALLKHFSNSTNAATAERTARACLLLPAADQELKQAVALAERAVQLRENSLDFRFFAAAKALAEYRLGRFEDAIKCGQKPGARDTWPTLLVLAMAHHRLGHTEQGRQLFDEAMKTFDWKNVNKEWGGIIHSLRREAEALLKVKSGVKEPVSEKMPK